MKTKILFVHTPTYFSSPWSVCKQIIHGLDRDRFDVHIVFDRDAGGSIGVQEGNGVTLVPWTFRPRIPVGGAAGSFLSRTMGRSWGTARSAVSLGRYARRHRIDVIHGIEDLLSALLTVTAARIGSTRSLIHYHTIPSTYTGRTLKLMRSFAMYADANIGVSAYVANDLRRLGVPQHTIGFVLNGVDENYFHPAVSGRRLRHEYGIRDDEILVVQSARFFQPKRQEDLLRAMEIARKEMPALRCLLIGWEDPHYSGPFSGYLEELKSIAASLELGDSVVFAPARPEADEIHAAADISVLASVAEPCGLVVSEAMATGKPTVGVGAGGIPEMIEDGVTGYLVPPCTPRALADRIVMLAKDPELRRTMGLAARARAVRALSATMVGRTFSEIYENLAQSKSLPVAARLPVDWEPLSVHAVQ